MRSSHAVCSLVLILHSLFLYSRRFFSRRWATGLLLYSRLAHVAALLTWFLRGLPCELVRSVTEDRSPFFPPECVAKGSCFCLGGLGAGPCSFRFWDCGRTRSRCPMRCALRIGLEGGRLGGALCRCAVGIGGESVV